MWAAPRDAGHVPGYVERARGLWASAEVATHQDLSGLFVARAIEQYLRPGGRFAFVMPAAVLSRRQFKSYVDYRAKSGGCSIGTRLLNGVVYLSIHRD